MAWKDNNDALTELVRQVKKIVKYYIKNSAFDKTYTGIISEVNLDRCTIKYNGKDISIKTTVADMYKKGDKVKFCVPMNNIRKAYLVCDVELMKRYVNERMETTVR